MTKHPESAKVPNYILTTQCPDTTGVVAAVVELGAPFANAVPEPFKMKWNLHSLKNRCRTNLAASKYRHYLNSLLHRWSTHTLPIGVTAHYVTSDLDEGPMIDQEVGCIDPAASTDDLADIGKDLESVTLNRAIKRHAERRVFIDGTKSVVLR